MLSNEEIRVLDLLPPPPDSTDEAKLVGQTRVVLLAENPAYESLSYVWGDGLKTAEITVDDDRFAITSGLAAALRQIRLPNKTRTLWVDQLCIKQDDVEEKAVQVPLMGQIYSKTTQCLIWFGEIDSSVSISAAQSVLDIIQFISGCKEDNAYEIWPPPPALESEQTLEEPIRALKFISVGQNPWWHRAWTLQEAIAPKGALVLWGPLSISWSVIVTASFNHLRHYIPALDHITAAQRDILGTLFAHVIGLQWAKEATHGPLDTAFRWNFRQASDPLDKVYAFLGLFPPGTLKRVQNCDYRLPPGTLYAMFTADLIEHHRDLNALAVRRHEVLPENTKGIPRWALEMGVDWHGRAVNINNGNAAWYLMHGYRSYHAAGELEIDMEKFHYDQETNALTLTGCLIDKIVSAGPKPRPDSEESGSTTLSISGAVDKIREWHALAGEFYRGRQWAEDLAGPRSWPESFWRGLLGNYFLNEEYCPIRYATTEDLEAAENFMRTGITSSVCRSIFATMCHRTMFLTEKGLLGFGPTDLAVDDEVWILRGGNVPFVVRPGSGSSVQGCHTFMGPSYLDGVMMGEAVDGREFTTEIKLV